VALLAALIPAVMPEAWMDRVHRDLGMGVLPKAPIVAYLTRSLSALYALHGALILFLAGDIRRYVAVTRCFAVLGVIFGFGMLVLDLSVPMPFSWTLGEGPMIIGLSCLIGWLARGVRPLN
jgi:hypothetical protein